jgi:NADH-quinone oxidoreductase subunit M
MPIAERGRRAMMTMLLLIVPLVAAVAIVFAKSEHAKWIALAGSLVTFLISVVLAVVFDEWGRSGFGIEAAIDWLPKFGISISMGADAVAMMLVLLTTMLMPLCVWGSFTAITERVREYYAWMMVLLAAMVGVFLARDLIFFYICFEFTLVPMFFLIAIYGGENRTKAAIKFFIYTFTGSLMALAALLYVTWQFAVTTGEWSFHIGALTEFASTLSTTEQAWILLGLMLGFAVKVPLFPVHTWLPLAHTEAPTAGSVILAAVLLKLGTYAMYRFILPMLPDAVVEYTPLIAVLAIIGVFFPLPQHDEYTIPMLNRSIALFVIWVTAILSVLRKRAEEETKILRGLLPICSYCKKIRDHKGYWKQIEVYIAANSQADFSHGLCPECGTEHYPDIFKGQQTGT